MLNLETALKACKTIVDINTPIIELNFSKNRISVISATNRTTLACINYDFKGKTAGEGGIYLLHTSSADDLIQFLQTGVDLFDFLNNKQTDHYHPIVDTILGYTS